MQRNLCDCWAQGKNETEENDSRRERRPLKKSNKSGVDRRRFLKGAAVGGVATLVTSSGAVARAPILSSAICKSACSVTTGGRSSAEVDVLTLDRSGSDFMVDVIKTLGFEYVAANPGSSYRGIHESLFNYGGQ